MRTLRNKLFLVLFLSSGLTAAGEDEGPVVIIHQDKSSKVEDGWYFVSQKDGGEGAVRFVAKAGGEGAYLTRLKISKRSEILLTCSPGLNSRLQIDLGVEVDDKRTKIGVVLERKLHLFSSRRFELGGKTRLVLFADAEKKEGLENLMELFHDLTGLLQMGDKVTGGEEDE